MLAESGPGSRQSAVLRFCITVLCVVVIMITAGHYFIKVIQSAQKTEAQTAVASYNRAVTQIHRNWLMQGKISRVEITGLDELGKPTGPWFFLVNSEGWPINKMTASFTQRGRDTGKPDCKALWFALQKNDRLDYTGQAIQMMVDDFGRLTEVTEVSFATKDQITWVCQNLVAQQLLFRYRLDTGKVEML